MKFYDTHFEDYIKSNEENSLHPKLNKMYETFPTEAENFKNIIFFGPTGVGKYTQMLSCIKKYSLSGLKYEKKISISYGKNTYFFKISDIHFEVDMSLLGCNSKVLWNEVFKQIIDIISARAGNIGIIVCKYFHDIHSELLETFYSYMQSGNYKGVSLKFILLTEQISFIPDNIINCCEVITVPRPNRSLYNKCLKQRINKAIELKFTIIKLKN